VERTGESVKHPIPAEALKESVAIVGRAGWIIIDSQTKVPAAVALRLAARARSRQCKHVIDMATCGDCWEYSGYCKPPAGYGVTESSGRPIYTHRLAYAIFRGPVPDGMEVCHSCDNPPCWNPAHLFVASHSDNVRDMDEKRRRKSATPRGLANGNATLTDEQVSAIRAVAQTSSQRSIAAQFGVSQSTVWRIVHGQTRA
jgi:hypothetical protein